MYNPLLFRQKTLLFNSCGVIDKTGVFLSGSNYGRRRCNKKVEIAYERRLETVIESIIRTEDPLEKRQTWKSSIATKTSVQKIRKEKRLPRGYKNSAIPGRR